MRKTNVKRNEDLANEWLFLDTHTSIPAFLSLPPLLEKATERLSGKTISHNAIRENLREQFISMVSTS